MRQHPEAVHHRLPNEAEVSVGSTPNRSVLRGPAVAAIACAVVFTAAGSAAANDWLQVFESEQIQPVIVGTSDLVALADLSAYGEVVVTGDVGVHDVADAATAAAETGLVVPMVAALPRGVSGEPDFEVGGAVSITFTFSADRAARSTAGTGSTMPPLPAGLDGSQVRLEAGPGVALIWSQPSGLPGLVVGRAVAPTVFSSGVPFEVMRDSLLSLPGFPDDVAEQLRNLAADGSAMPLPVPAESITTSSAEVDGFPATVLATRDRSLAAVVWFADGVITVVAGALDTDEVLSVARNLR